ncbi:eEF1-gamma domain-containing protein [Coemansia reversa NRRL 1564]|uniref:EEF1-gamma domain-containing protein n=1 Tax=Coemansia reversa (strain ATCC 12441 / NRRL 1564) TaxID=763665 RepID=A0A2G5BD42_COERN|nr:eEF1-gamma domain-containing protein [Coemansia reversa NRRL 1564]|eukprot:PIA16929.1 eEF1-gamma domain-containing protein [Coemansia reversa NRRL 1564]
MAPIGTLIGPTVNQRNYKARIVAHVLGIELNTTPSFQMGVENKTPEFLAKYPAGKVPVFEGADGFQLTDSSAIANYVASKGPNNAQLLGETDEERAQILQHSFFAEGELAPAMAGFFYPTMGFAPYIKPAVQAAEEQYFRFLGVLNTILIDKTFLVGERLTIADIIVACNLVVPFKVYLTADDRKQYRNVTRYFKTMVSQPSFKAVIGDVALCEKRIQPPTPAKKDKKEKKPAEQPKKAEKKEKPAKVEEEEEEAPKPKPKSKLESLPETSMKLDDWKRFYSNNDTKPDAMEWLWKNIDADGYSFWKVVYKYNDELTRLFMTNNLIGGFFARLERARKYAFGNLLTLGVDNDNMIWGYFIVRGKEIPEEVTDAADFESFEWTAADHTDPKTRAEIEDCFAWEGPTLPREFYDGKTYK